MKIRTQFIISTVLLGSFLLLVSASEIITNQGIQKLNKQEEHAAQIEREAYELGYLANDYLLYRESQQAERWESKFASFSENLSNMQVDTLEQQALLANLKTNQRRLSAVFTEIRTNIESAPHAQEAAIDTKLMQVSWSRLEVQNQGLIFDASRLEGLLREQEDRLRRASSLLNFMLIGVLGAFLLGNYGLTFRRTLRAIAELQAGTRIIGSGDLDFAIPVKHKDEIGELSLAFNQMAASLKEVTASKTDLEWEMAERAQAEQALRLSEKKFALAFANNPAAITLTRLDDGIFQDVNDTWQALTGYSRKEAIGFSARKLPIWPTAKAAARFVQELRDKGALHWHEQEFRKKSGEFFVAQLSAQLLPIQGELMILTTLIDITERKRAEEALRESERRLIGVLESMPDAFVSFDADLRYTYVNANAEHLQAARREELIGKDVRVVYPDAESYKTISQYEQVLREQKPVTLISHHAGFDKWVEVQAFPTPDGVSVFYKDVSAQVKAEEALRESEQRYRGIVETAEEGIATHEPDGTITYVNQRMADMLGYSREELIGMSSLDFVDEEERDAVIQARESLKERGSFSRERRLHRKDGSILWTLINVSPRRDGAGNFVGYLAMHTDITAHKQAEEALRASEARFRLALKNAPVSVAVQDRDLRYLWAYNQQSVMPDQIIGHFDHEIFTADEAANFTAIKRRVLEEGTEQREQVWLDRPTGRTYLDICWEPIRDNTGDIVGVASATMDLTPIKLAEETLRDITERLQAQSRALEESNNEMRSARLAALNLIEDALEAKKQLEQVNARLRESEEGLRRAQEIAHLGSWELDLKNNRLAWSDEVYRIFGLQPQEFTATYEAFLDAVHPDDRAAVDTAYSGSIREGRDRYEIEHRVVKRASGEVRIVHEKCQHVRDETGQIIRSVGMVHDVTERVQAEEALRAARDELELRVQERTKELERANKELLFEIYEREEAERQLLIQTTAMEAAANGIVITDREGTILWINPALTRMTGYTESDLIDQNMRLFKSGQHSEDYYLQMWANILAGEVWQGELTNRRKDGSLYIEEQTITPVRNESGLISHFIAIKQDITEHKRIEAALDLERLRLKNILDTIPDGVYIIDQNYDIEYANPVIEREFGSIDGRKCFAYFHDLVEPCPWCKNVEVFAGMRFIREQMYAKNNKSYEIFDAPIANSDGSLSKLKILHDITQRKQMEQDLEDSNQELKAAGDAERKQRKLAEALVEAALVLNKSLELDEVLKIILEQIRQVIPYQFANIGLLEGDAFYEASHQGEADLAATQVGVMKRYFLGDFPLLDKMCQSGQPVLIPDTEQEPDWSVLESFEWCRSFLSSPLIVEKQVIGFLNLFSEQAAFFTQEMQERLVAFAAHAAAAIQNAWLFEQVRASSERLQSLSRRLVDVQENERLYIARELHDEAGQMLTSLLVDLRLLEKEASRPKAILKIISEMEGSLNTVIENLHRVAMALRPASLDHVGLVAALRQHVEIVAEKQGLKVSFDARGFQERLPANVETVLYRIVQESLTNIVRHACASQVDVVLTVRNDKLVLIVEDDGIGFDPGSISADEHLGLFGMRERAEMIDGKLVVESAPGKGTTIMVEVDYVNTNIGR